MIRGSTTSVPFPFLSVALLSSLRANFDKSSGLGAGPVRTEESAEAVAPSYVY